MAKCGHIGKHTYSHISHLHITVYTQGVERFANYKGYGASLEFAGECRDPAEVRCYITYSVQLPHGLFTLAGHRQSVASLPFSWLYDCSPRSQAPPSFPSLVRSCRGEPGNKASKNVYGFYTRHLDRGNQQ